LKTDKQPPNELADLIRDLPRLNPWPSIVLTARIGDAMQIETDAKVSLFVQDRATGRLVFNSKAIEALGLSPTELAQRGYPLDGEVASPVIVPEGGTTESFC
jgi:hypothetical protein